jgi:hypothetical protein
VLVLVVVDVIPELFALLLLLLLCCHS